MKKRTVLFLVLLVLTSFLLSCVMTPAPKTSRSGFAIAGFIGKTPEVPASGATVTLLDGAGKKQLQSATTNFFGTSSFAQLPPGHYTVAAGKFRKKIQLQDRDIRMDMDLSAPDGGMDYFSHSAKKALKEAQSQNGSGGVGGGRSGPNDPALAKQIAGVWWGYAGSTERKIGLCPDGTYMDYTESGYSGRTHDSGGYQTGAWGNASQRSGSGTWSVQGNMQQGTIRVRYNNGRETTIQFRQCGKSGCLLFNGNTLCLTSKSCN